ncbi:MAG: demethylmenaquinone methyltransferase [Frankiales bacterium]|nr:demethylmenaquinone methyltransferase [Frankiales bacterium]
MPAPASETTWVRASLDKIPDDVASMFDGVADRYDVANEVLALGQTRVWRRALVEAVSPLRGEVILDVAAGTGSSSEPLSGRGATVIPCDFSPGMLLVGHVRRPALPFTAGDALHLPFGDSVFDAATISFGLRNVVDPITALTELRRVVRPGGRLVVCEFSHPRRRLLRKLYSEYLMGAIPSVARAVASNPDAYVYLAESIQAWPDQATLAERIREAGWDGVEWMNIHGGIVALHRARRA